MLQQSRPMQLFYLEKAPLSKKAYQLTFPGDRPIKEPPDRENPPPVKEPPPGRDVPIQTPEKKPPIEEPPVRKIPEKPPVREPSAGEHGSVTAPDAKRIHPFGGWGHEAADIPGV